MSRGLQDAENASIRAPSPLLLPSPVSTPPPATHIPTAPAATPHDASPSPSPTATRRSDEGQSSFETTQIQSAPANSPSALCNQGHKRRWQNLSPVCMEPEEWGEVEGEDTQADNEEEVVATVLRVSSADPRPKVDVRTWKDLREQLKDDITNAHRQRARLTTINQLLLLHNFATLQIKGIGRIAASQEIARQWHEDEGAHFARRVRILARHYQIHEQLPAQSWGGYRGSSIFNDKHMQSAVLDWLSKLPTGEVSPTRFCKALTEEILPYLSIRKDTVSEWTARCWLVKLGWRRTRLKKGVYMDGHERSDVVKYQNETFLPLMAEYERQMVRWTENEDGTFECVEPELSPGEKRIIPLFQDESSFHAGEYKSNIW
jgi:hypothetical protein